MVNQRSMDDIGDFIFVSDEPAESDLIVIPGTLYNAWPICRRAFELYRAGMAPKILVTGRFSQSFSSFAEEIGAVFALHPAAEEASGLVRAETADTEAGFLKAILLSMGVCGSDIITEDRSVNTFDNAFNAAALLKERGIPHASMLLCPKPFHARRALMTFQHAFPRTRILVCPASVPLLEKSNWQSTAGGYAHVLNELEKCASYFSVPGMYDAAVKPLP